MLVEFAVWHIVVHYAVHVLVLIAVGTQNVRFDKPTEQHKVDDPHDGHGWREQDVVEEGDAVCPQEHAVHDRNHDAKTQQHKRDQVEPLVDLV